MKIQDVSMTPRDVTSSEAARIIYEALQSTGWSADPEAVASHVRGLQRGLPAEDEFATVLSWLGRCRLLHKLDQFQVPPESNDRFRVPDLLAVFDIGHKEMAVLIEVKSRQKQKLSWTARYLDALRNYGEVVGLPVLVAWKYFNVWSLFDVSHFKLAKTNYHIRFGEAMKENLLGLLAGDFAFVMQPGVGLHLLIEKEVLEGVEETESGRSEKWKGTVAKAYFTDGDGYHLSKLSGGVWPLFLASPFVAMTHDEGTHVLQSFVIQEEATIEFAHRAVTTLLQIGTPEETEIDWRRVLKKNAVPTSAQTLRIAAAGGLSSRLVKYVFDVQPKTMPSFARDPS
jgi:Holliday junction resolvase